MACLVCLNVFCLAAQPSEQPELTGAAIATQLRQVSLDPAQTYSVRDLRLTRGDIKIYLTEGLLSFVTPVAGRRVAAVFTTAGVEAGDAEILVLPPQPSERASLASFTKTPNLDEHFNSAIFLFSDDTAAELLSQIHQGELRPAPKLAAQLGPNVDPVLRNISAAIDVRLVQSLLDHHSAAEGFFYSVIGGRDLGAFDAIYQPDQFEPVSVGRSSVVDGREDFTLWASFRPRHDPPYVPPPPRIGNYSIDTTIHPDLSMSVTARFDIAAEESDGRVIPLRLSERLKIASATVDSQPVEVLQRSFVLLPELMRGIPFLLITAAPLSPATRHHVEIRYEGSVIRQTGQDSYFVDERNAWFPYSEPTRSSFDLTFRCPARLRLVSTGELVSDELIGDQRVVHRRTEVPEALAGFNLGDYHETTDTHGLYRVECYANQSAANGMADIPKETEDILDYYTRRWIKLPIHSVAVSPVPGYFGQGFPGLIYLSSISYIREEDRPAVLRNPLLDTFFSLLLLPHEVAHQWWGNIVTSANYRAGWLLEAMASYSALQYVERSQDTALEAGLNRYRQDLLGDDKGHSVESVGPVDFGVRLLDSAGNRDWDIVTYEKGAWILHMLRERLGEQGFNQMQLRLLHDFAAKPLTNEDFRTVASQFVPPGVPDKTLSLFFDTWIYGTGIPKLALSRTREGLSLTVSGVDEDFTADVPLACQSKTGQQETRWVRASTGPNDIPLPPGSGVCSLPAPTDFLYQP